MPIVLVDRRTERKLEIGDSSISYFVAGGDLALAEIRRSFHGVTAEQFEQADSLDRGIAAAVKLCARCVTDWTNVLDAKGEAIPWPDPGKATGVPGREAPSIEALKIREALLANLPWDVLASLDRSVSTAREEAAASGKGSPTGSGG